LSGFYRVIMTFDPFFVQRRLDTATPPDWSPSIFTAMQEQLGLKLQSKETKIPILVVDHIERPTPNP
jgi:uncharacterized protein (TIGR03435 family)